MAGRSHLRVLRHRMRAESGSGTGALLDALAIGSITLFCTFGGSMFGMIVRRIIPPSHLDADSKDVVRLGMGLVATMTALLLGLVTAAAKSTFDAQDAAV